MKTNTLLRWDIIRVMRERGGSMSGESVAQALGLDRFMVAACMARMANDEELVVTGIENYKPKDKKGWKKRNLYALKECKGAVEIKDGNRRTVRMIDNRHWGWSAPKGYGMAVGHSALEYNRSTLPCWHLLYL